MSWFGNSKSDDDERGADYKVHNDGSTTEYRQGKDRSDYYNRDKNDQYENDERGRSHGHVVIRNDGSGRERVAHVRNGHGDSTSYDKDWDNSSNNSSGSCYIATASLQGAMPIEILEPLKQWRYVVLEKSSFGNRLSSYYRRTAPQLAKEIAGMPRMSAFLRNTIVKPAIRLANRPPSVARNTGMFTLFLIGLSIAEVVKVLRK